MNSQSKSYEELLKEVEDLKLENESLRALYRPQPDISSPDLHAILVEKASDGFWLLDKHFMTLFVNPAMEEMLGYTKEEMQGRSWYDFGDPEWVARAKELERRREGGVKEPHRFLFIHKSGRKVLARIATTPLYDNEGNFSGALGILSDITKQEEAEEAIKTKDMLNSIAKSAGLGMCITNPDYTIAWYNDLFVKWFGELDVTKGRNCFEVFERRGEVCPGCPSKISFDTGEAAVSERYGISTEDGSDRIFALTTSPIKDADGNVIQVVEISQDITERKMAEETLRVNEENISVTMQSIGDGVISTDTEGNVFRMNPVAEKMCGISVSEARGKPFSDVFRIINSETREPVLDPVRLVKESGKIFDLGNHTVLISRDGKEYQIADSAAPIKNKNGKIIGVVVVFSDVTEKYKAEKALRDSEEKHRILFESASDAIFINSAEGRTLAVNSLACERYGYTYDEILSLQIGEVDVPEQQKYIPERIAALLEHGYTAFETVHRRKDGLRIPTEVSAKQIVWDGQPVIMSTCRDITERKQAEEALRDSEIKYRALVENSPDAIIIHVEGIIVYANTESVRMMAASSIDDILGKPVLQFVRPDYHEFVIARMKQAVKEQTACSRADEVFIRLDGTEVDVEVKTIPIHFDHKPAVQAIVRDITQRKLAEIELRKSKENFQAIANYAASWEAWFNTEGKLVWMNPLSKNLTGFTPEEYIASENYIAMVIAEEDIARVYEVFLTALQGSSGENLEARILRKDGSKFWASISWRPIFDSNNNSIGFRTSAQDITERKQMEEELRLKNEQLLELNASKDKFFSIIAHDLRSPFHPLLSISSLLKDSYDTLTRAEIEKYTGSIYAIAKRVFGLLQNLLEWAAAQSGRIQNNPVHINLVSKSTEVLQGMRENYTRKNIEVHLDIDISVTVSADDHLLSSVLQNLLSNAIKFSHPGGSIIVRAHEDTRQEAISRRDRMILVSVIDAGVGIAQERVSRLFSVEKYETTKGTNQEVGSGLGLALCKEFVEQLGGKLWAESTLGKGSTFYFTVRKASIDY